MVDVLKLQIVVESSQKSSMNLKTRAHFWFFCIQWIGIFFAFLAFRFGLKDFSKWDDKIVWIKIWQKNMMQWFESDKKSNKSWF